MQAFLGAPAVVKTPKSSLYEFFQIRGGTPKFEVQQKPLTQPHLPSFSCQLTIPRLPPGPDGKEAQTLFTAEASTKKAAEQAAAEQALGYIRSRGLMPPPVTTAPPAGGQQQPFQSWKLRPDLVPPDLHVFQPVTTAADVSDAGPPQPAGPSPTTAGAVVTGTASPDVQQQPGNVVSPAAGAPPGHDSALPGGDQLAMLDRLKPADIKQRLVEAQQRVQSLESQLGRYSDWHRRMREVALEDIA